MSHDFKKWGILVMYLLYLDTIICDKGGSIVFIFLFFYLLLLQEAINAVSGIIGKYVQCY